MLTRSVSILMTSSSSFIVGGVGFGEAASVGAGKGVEVTGDGVGEALADLAFLGVTAFCALTVVDTSEFETANVRRDANAIRNRFLFIFNL